MASEAFIARYICAWVRMNSKQDISQWSFQEVLDCFTMLPKPSVSVDQFALANGDTSVVKLPGVPVRGDFIEILQASFGKQTPPAEVTPDGIAKAE